ncbi:MAG: AAA family ATPase [Betaproteobacteria bacterium]|nr:AAA family ATPase [Betaproteobacteria bacterium]MBP6319855.1 AAA family ATPase [Rubrivivax sp.]
MNLCLLGPMRWQTDSLQAQPLPVVLPAALLLVLARHGHWMSRAELAALFWPDHSDASAALNLRVNLHKARRLLARLGIDEPIQVERRRLRWAPPTDLAGAAPGSGTPALGFELPEFEPFDRWLRTWRQSWQGRLPQGLAAAASTLEADEPAAKAAAGADFYGRRVELARLRASRLPVLVVEGEAGVGKSRLVAEAFAGLAWLRCREGLSQMAFGAVAELFNGHPHWLQDLGAYRLDVARLLPDTAPDEPLPPLDAITARVRLFEGLARAAERHAGLLAVDDLQWADAATLEWLVMLAHRSRLRWVATARSGELSASASEALRSLQAAGVAGVVTLQGLDRDALNALLHDRRPDLAGPEAFPRPHAWLDALWSYTAGNAFCAIELMQSLTNDCHPDQLPHLPLPERVAGMLQRRRDLLPEPARAVVDAAAIAIGRPTLAQLASVAGLDLPTTLAAVECAQQQGLLQGTACRHDLVREAMLAGLTPARAAELHRRMACRLADEGAEPETIASHWRCAGDVEAAWPYVLRAAQRLRERGEHAGALAALRDLQGATKDEALALRAEIMLAQEHLFDDLVAGRRALESVQVRACRLPSGLARQTIEAHALAGLVDNAVFSGDLAQAGELAIALRERLPGLARDVLLEAHPVLIEAAMREGDFGAAAASLQGLRQAGAAPAVVLSFEAQIHWFSGAVREARQVFEQLLAQHPDYCRGLTIENDLAVMSHALGDLATAEAMARRSLQSWAGVAHTEALSCLVLGSTLASGGRFGEALETLARAHQLGLRQGSALFVSEALVRRARLHWAAGDAAAAREATLAARAQAGSVTEPLRASALALMEVLTALDDGPAPGTPEAAALAALEQLSERSRHPLVQVRHWRAQAAAAARHGDAARALEAARRQAAVAQRAELLEWRCEALQLIGQLDAGPAAEAARRQSMELAQAQGYGWLAAAVDLPSCRRR